MSIKKKNPFVDEGEGEGTPEPAEKEPVIDLDAEEEDPIDSATPASPSRQEKRAARAWMNRDEKERLQREAEEGRKAREEAQQAILQAQQATAWAQQLASQGQRQQVRDPIDDAEDLWKRERTLLNKEYQQRFAETKGAMTPDEVKKFEDRAIEIENRGTQLQVQRALRGMGVQQQDPRVAQVEAFKANLMQRYPDVVRSPQALLYAEGEQRKAAARGQDPWSPTVIDAAMQAAERDILNKRPQQSRTPDPVLRDRLAAPPRGASGGGGREEGPRQVTMTKEMRKMANAAFPHIKDEAKRYSTWYKAQAAQSDD